MDPRTELLNRSVEMSARIEGQNPLGNFTVGRRAPDGMIYAQRKFWNTASFWVVLREQAFPGETLRNVEEDEVRKAFGVAEGECLFCHVGEADIHHLTRVARAARTGVWE